MDPHAEGLVRPVAHDVGGVLATRPLDGGVRPSGARPQQPRQLGHHRAVRHVVETLVDDPEALLDLVHPEQVARQAVALLARRDVEFELREDAVRVRPPDVERDARRAQVRAGHDHAEGGRRVDRAQTAHPADEDLVLVEERVPGLDLLGRVAHPVAEPAHELVVQVPVDAADPEVVEQHPLTGQAREHVDDLVALDEGPQDRRQATEVQGHPAEEQRVAGDPVELRREHADVLGATRDLHVQQLLERHDARPLAEQRAHVLQRVEVADGLVVVRVLAQLLDAAMEVPQHRVEIDHLLAVELEDHPQHAVGRGVLRTHVDEHLAVTERVELRLTLRPRGIGRDRLEHAELAVELDARIVERGTFADGGHVSVAQRADRRTSAVAGAFRGVWVRSIGRTPAPGERAASSGR